MVKRFDNKKFKQELKKQGYNYCTFAEKLQKFEPKACRSNVWQWAARKTEPSVRYLIPICKILGKSMSFFVKSSKK